VSNGNDAIRETESLKENLENERKKSQMSIHEPEQIKKPDEIKLTNEPLMNTNESPEKQETNQEGLILDGGDENEKLYS
jgi:hypothetical protein